LHAIIGSTMHLYAAPFSSATPLLQPDHFKSQGYGPGVCVCTVIYIVPLYVSSACTSMYGMTSACMLLIMFVCAHTMGCVYMFACGGL